MHDWLGLLSLQPILACTTSYLSAKDQIDAVGVLPSLLISTTDVELPLMNPVCASAHGSCSAAQRGCGFEPKLAKATSACGLGDC
jgi:hypothetical protein